MIRNNMPPEMEKKREDTLNEPIAARTRAKGASPPIPTGYPPEAHHPQLQGGPSPRGEARDRGSGSAVSQPTPAAVTMRIETEPQRGGGGGGVGGGGGMPHGIAAGTIPSRQPYQSTEAGTGAASTGTGAAAAAGGLGPPKMPTPRAQTTQVQTSGESGMRAPSTSTGAGAGAGQEGKISTTAGGARLPSTGEIHETVESAAQKAQATAESVKRQAKPVLSSAEEKISQVQPSTAQQLAQQGVHVAQQIASQATETAQHVVQQVVATVESGVGTVKEEAQQIVDEASHLAQQAAEAAKQGIQQVTSQVSQVPQKVSQMLPSQILPDTRTWSNKVQQLPTRVRSLSSHATDTLRTTTSHAIQTLRQTPSKLGPTLQNTKQRMIQSMNELPSQITSWIRENMSVQKMSERMSSLTPTSSKIWMTLNLLLNLLLPILMWPTPEAKAVLSTFGLSSLMSALMYPFTRNSRLQYLTMLPYIPLVLYLWAAPHVETLPKHYGKHQTQQSSVQDRLHKVRVQVTQEPSDLFNAWIYANTMVNTGMIILSLISLSTWAGQMVARLLKGTKQVVSGQGQGQGHQGQGQGQGQAVAASGDAKKNE